MLLKMVATGTPSSTSSGGQPGIPGSSSTGTGTAGSGATTFPTGSASNKLLTLLGGAVCGTARTDSEIRDNMYVFTT